VWPVDQAPQPFALLPLNVIRIHACWQDPTAQEPGAGE
jgi:hypothetical protein